MGFSLARLAPNFNRLNVWRRLKDMPGNNMAAFFQAIVMIPVMFWLTWSLVRDRLPELLRLAHDACLERRGGGRACCEGRDAEGLVCAGAAGHR